VNQSFQLSFHEAVSSFQLLIETMMFPPSEPFELDGEEHRAKR
jgi:hypothetical protein